MRVLITGAAGFLGSHLTDRLIEEGHSVVGVDNLVTGNRHNIAHLSRTRGFEFLHQDVTEPFNVEGPLDYVLHFASPASPIDYLQLPMETLKVGSYGTHNMLELALSKGARFLLASTSECYGDPEKTPQPEDYWGNVNPVGPRSVYDEAKRYAEATTMAYHRHRNLDTRIVRIFNTYGPRMRRDDGRVIPTFINQALKGEDLTAFGDGSQTRSFCYVSDLIAGIRRLMDAEVHTPVNIGAPHEMTINEIAQKIIRLIGSKSRIVYRELPTDDPKRRRPDITKAKKLLGWEPTVDLEEGLRQTIEFFRNGRP